MSERNDTLMQLCAAPFHGTGTVMDVEEATARCVVKTLQGELPARRAASCLLAPQPGDRVWLAGDLSEGIFVTAILERGDAAPARIDLPADSTLQVAGGALNLRAENLHLGATRLSVQADSAALCVQTLTGIGREATWSFGRVRIIADLLESFADKLLQFSRWSQRTVDGIDQVRSRQIDYRADQTLQLQAGNLIADASNLVKVDGKQIHFG